MIKIIFTLIVLIGTNFSNGQTKISNSKSFILNGHIQNCASGIIVLQYINNGKWVRDTSDLQNGQFHFTGNIEEPVLAGLKGKRKIINHEDVNFVNLYLEPAIQNIELVENDFVHFKMTGSKSQNELDTLKMQTNYINEKYKVITDEINKENNKYSSAINLIEKDIIKQKLDELIGKLIPMNKELDSTYILFALNHSDSYVSATYLYNPLKSISIDSAKSIFNKLSSRVQNSPHGKIITNYFEQINKNAIGKTPYNFSTQDINGSNISLAKFLDKYVYIDFWASWCIPCREAIPHLKQLFNKFNNKGLEIITISIDKDSKKWKEAVIAENITKWHNLIVTKEIEDNYDNVQNAIPSGILISKEGKIIWKSNNEEKLEDALIRLIR